jgi:aryl-alcohol dehydrogenase-like predicted oxidoreductase
VSEVSLGSWLTLGTRVDDDLTTRLVHRAFDLGINLFDTADVYQDGLAEETLGHAIASLPRSEVFVATKCFFPMSDRPDEGGLSREHVTRSVEHSLKRLGVERIDLHQCHRFDPDTPLEETIRTYDALTRQGKVRHWGVSQWTPSQITEACALADEIGAPRPVSNQPEYSILSRGIERGVIPASAREGLSQIVFSPLAQGTLTGKYSGGRIPEQSRANDPKRNRWMGRGLDSDILDRVDRLAPMAADLGISLAQLALAWCLREPNVASVIIGATRTEQLEENAEAVSVTLPDDVVRAIDTLFPAPSADRPDVPGSVSGLA